MTANEIKAGLIRWNLDFTGIKDCTNCPFRTELTGEGCGTFLPKMALSYILELEAGAMNKEFTGKELSI